MAEERGGVGGWESIARAAEARAADWARALHPPTDPDRGERAPELLAGVRADAGGLDFTRRLLEHLLGSADPFAAALGLREVAHELPDSMPVRDRLAVRAGGIAALGLPWAVLPLARRWFRDRVSSVAFTAKFPSNPEKPIELAGLSDRLLAKLEPGTSALLALGGEPVLGADRVEIEVARLVALAEQTGIDQLLVDPLRLLPGGTDWTFDADVTRAVDALRPVLEAARQHGTAILLDAVGYRGARLAPEVLLRAAGDARLDGVRVGLVVPAELPESRRVVERIGRWAVQRASEGGTATEIVLADTGMAGAERIASIRSGLPVPTIDGRTAVAAQLLRLAHLALGYGTSVRLVVQSEEPRLLAAATVLAERHGAGEQLGLQLRAGADPALARVLATGAHEIRTRLPVIPSGEPSGLAEPLLALAAHAADPDRVDFAEAIAEAAEPFPESHRTQLRAREWDPSERDSALFYRPPADPDRFDTGGLTAAVLGLIRGSTGEITLEAAGPALRIPVISEAGLAAEPVTDASRTENREWVRSLVSLVAEPGESGEPGGSVGSPDLDDPATTPPGFDAEATVSAAETAAGIWQAPRHGDRATRVRRLALGTVAARDRLIAVLAAESGDPVSTLDAAVGDAVDAARWLGRLSEELGSVRGAEFEPDRVALVVVDAGVPFAERAEAILAVVAAGSAAIAVVDRSVLRSTRVLLEEWRAAGLPDGVVTLVEPDPPAGREHASDAGKQPGADPQAGAEPRDHRELAGELAVDSRVDRALVLGRRETAVGLLRRRPDLRIEGRFEARASVLVTGGADVDSAIPDVIASAFGATAADPLRARQLVLLGGIARSRRFRARLADAVRAVRAGHTGRSGSVDPLDLEFGPLPAPPSAAGLRALTELDPGEEWLVEPERLDASGLIWRPGVRWGVKRSARFWRDSIGMPVLGVTHARSLDEAIAIQNDAGSGGAAAIHSLDADEILPWLERVEAASLAVCRPTTGARIEQRPVGGWNDAGLGLGSLAGGPNRLLVLGSWSVREGTQSQTLHLRGLDPEVQLLIETAQESLDYDSFDRVRRAALSDALSWRTSLGIARDTVGLGIERNLVRHWPVPTQLRLAEEGELAELVRVLAAALIVRAPVSVSTGVVLPAPVVALLERQGIDVSLERDDDWLERMAVIGTVAEAAGGSDGGSGSGGGLSALIGVEDGEVRRIRLIGGDRVRAAEWLGNGGRVALWAEPVTMAGPVELLTLLREQSISIATHRHGLAAPIPAVEDWVVELGR